MKNWRETLINGQTPIRKALETIDASSVQVAVVVDDQNRLRGTVTDGDIRRGILKGNDLETPVEVVMNREPTVASPEESNEKILETMTRLQIRQIPLVDSDGVVCGMEYLDELLQPPVNDNWVVLMAGGLGKRMSPLTDNCPKPMLKVQGKPVLEIILNQFLQAGFRNFFIAVNYKAEMIEEYFQSGEKWGVQIRYLREKERLGTAGALSLLPEVPGKPFIVMNADLLTKVNMNYLLDFHQEQDAELTMCIREFDFQVPYGVVRIKDNRVADIDEKPIQKFFVNAGIYALNPSALQKLTPDEPCDMTSLMNRLLQSRSHVAAYPVREYWIDIGRHGDFERAQREVPGRLIET